jgi:hypothetical protein
LYRRRSLFGHGEKACTACMDEGRHARSKDRREGSGWSTEDRSHAQAHGGSREAKSIVAGPLARNARLAARLAPLRRGFLYMRYGVPTGVGARARGMCHGGPDLNEGRAGARQAFQPRYNAALYPGRQRCQPEGRGADLSGCHQAPNPGHRPI